jgi:hypothetical protein
VSLDEGAAMAALERLATVLGVRLPVEMPALLRPALRWTRSEALRNSLTPGFAPWSTHSPVGIRTSSEWPPSSSCRAPPPSGLLAPIGGRVADKEILLCVHADRPASPFPLAGCPTTHERAATRSKVKPEGGPVQRDRRCPTEPVAAAIPRLDC